MNMEEDNAQCDDFEINNEDNQFEEPRGEEARIEEVDRGRRGNDDRGQRGRGNDNYGDEGVERGAARQRCMLVPLESQLRNSRLITRTTEVSMNDLSGDEIFQNNVNLNRQFINAQMLRIITPTRDMKAQLYAIRSRRNNRSNTSSSSEANFSRIYLLRIISETNISDHGRLFYLLESKNSNATLFNRNIDFRDNGTITIGTIVRVVGPQAIETRMGDIVMVKTPNPLIVMQRAGLPTFAINSEIQANQSMAFCLNERILNVNQTYVVQTSCSGLMCDKGRVEDWNGSKGCGCVGMHNNISNLAIVHSIWFESDNDGAQRRISHNNFSSTKFSLTYLSNRIPSSTRQSTLSATGGDGDNALWDIEDAVDRVKDFVNNNGGWTIIGWYKRGAIKDKSLVGESASESNRNGATNNDEVVGSGQLHFHIVELLPTNRRFLDSNTPEGRRLHRLKYDVSNLSGHY